MVNKLYDMVANLYKWTEHWAHTSYGPWALFGLAFAESSFFPIPPDVLLIALAIINPENSLWYATICTAGSILGGMFGYFIGIKGGRPVLERFVSAEKIKLVHNYFEKYEAWAITIAGFTPIPYKIFTISAGVFYINFKIFVLASILGRAGRFFIVGTLIMFFGAQIKELIKNYFDIISIVFVVLLILGFYAMKFIRIKKNEPEILLKSEE
ncbi:MAG: YqaA family protein [bacterium]|nr:YqaA family protein [bacterium]